MAVRITCGSCGLALYEMERPFQIGERVEADRMRPLPGVPPPTPVSETRCPFCKAQLLDGGWPDIKGWAGHVLVETV